MEMVLGFSSRKIGRMESFMYEIKPEVLLFFDKHADALPIYQNFAERLFERFPETSVKVQKTQITFSNRHVYACVSFLRVKKKAEMLFQLRRQFL